MQKPAPEQPEVDASPEEIEIIRERLKTFDRDAAKARPWPEVKAELLKPQP